MAPEDSEVTPEVTRYRLTGSRESPGRMSVDTGDGTFLIGDDVNPVEYFLGSLLGCVNSTASVVARDVGIRIEALECTIEGELNYDRYRGIDTNDRAGLQSITIEVEVTSSASDGELEELLAAIEARCPLTETVINGTPIEADVSRGD